MGEGRNFYGVLVGKPEGKDHLEDRGVDGKMGSKWTLGKLVGWVWCGFTWLRVGIVKPAVVNAVMNLRFLAPRS
jgi:hypothetical protein